MGLNKKTIGILCIALVLIVMPVIFAVDNSSGNSSSQNSSDTVYLNPPDVSNITNDSVYLNPFNNSINNTTLSDNISVQDNTSPADNTAAALTGSVVLNSALDNSSSNLKLRLNNINISVAVGKALLSKLRGGNKIDSNILDNFSGNYNQKVRAIVMLDSSAVDKLNTLNSRRTKIKANQDSVLSLLNSSDFDLKYEYTNLNAITGDFNLRALQVLEDAGIVSGVREDTVYKPLLAESAPLIGAPYVWNTLNYTGRGETVCVVDSGVDYTHPNIGGSSCHLTQQNESYNLSSPNPYPDNYDNTWTITKPGYSSISVHFNTIGLEVDGYDYINILDRNNNIIQKITTSGSDVCGYLYNFTSFSVPGDTIKIELVSDESNNCSGFKTDNAINSSWQNCRNFLGGWDFANNDADPMDENGHGTHVTGIIASNNNTYRGIASDANILMAKIAGVSGSSSEGLISAGVDWCTSMKNTYNVSIITISYGKDGFISPSSCDDQTLDSTAVNSAFNAGIFVDAASGNDGSTIGVDSPSCASGAVPVGSVGDGSGGYTADVINGFTNRAPSFSNFLLAPGALITSTYIVAHGLWANLAGTSMSAPHVAGLAALMLQANNTLTPTQIRTIMQNTGVPIYDVNTSTTYKRINATAAVLAVMPQAVLPNYSISQVVNGANLENRLYLNGFHFMTIIGSVGNNGIFTIRPHPGVDVNGWGSSLYMQPFIAGATLQFSKINNVSVFSGGISVNVTGKVSYGGSSDYGNWSANLVFSYNSSSKTITGNGTYNIQLSGLLSPTGQDLNLYKLASNYLSSVPLLNGSIGDTGDMKYADVLGNNPLTNLHWIPGKNGSTFPGDLNYNLSINAVGDYNQVDTLAQGYGYSIAAAYKPSMKVVLTSQQTGIPMIFGGFYDTSKSQDFTADNVGITPLVLKSSSYLSYTFNVGFESDAIPGDGNVSDLIDISFIGNNIDFGTLSPGAANSSATNNSNYYVKVNPTTNVNVNITQSGVNYTSGGNSIPISNMKSNKINSLTGAVIMSSADSVMYSNIAPNTNNSLYYWLSIPPGMNAGTYSSTITIKAYKT